MFRAYSKAHPNKRDQTRDDYSIKRLHPFFGNLPLNDLNGSDVRAYIDQRLSEGVGPGTINKEIGLMSSAINWAKLELEWDIPNPFQGRRLEEPDGRHRWLTHEEAEALIEAAKQEPQAPHLVDFILFGLNTGLRTGEMLELEWRRVDLHTNLIYLRPRDQKNKELGSVPINQQARSALIRRQSFRASHCPDSPWVFCNKKGSRIGSIKKSFATAVRRADLDDVNPHDLRRTCGGWLVQAGISLHEVSKLLRHSDVRVTEKIYAHLAPENLAHAVSVLDHRASRMLNEIDREIQNLNRTAQAIE